MNKQEIQAAIDDAKEALEEVLEERMMTLGGTGVHLGAERAAYLREQFEREEAELRAKIAELEAELEGAD